MSPMNITSLHFLFSFLISLWFEILLTLSGIIYHLLCLHLTQLDKWWEKDVISSAFQSWNPFWILDFTVPIHLFPNWIIHHPCFFVTCKSKLVWKTQFWRSSCSIFHAKITPITLSRAPTTTASRAFSLNVKITPITQPLLYCRYVWKIHPSQHFLLVLFHSHTPQFLFFLIDKENNNKREEETPN